MASLRDDSLALRLCYKHSVPLGRFPTFYDCATNISSLRDGSPGSTIVLQTFRPAGTVSYVRRLCYTFGPAGTGWLRIFVPCGTEILVVNIGGYSMPHIIGGEDFTVYATCDRWCPASRGDAMFVETV